MHIALLDTNVILRFLLEDHPEHFRYAKNLFQQAEQGKRAFYIDAIVVAELVWTLSSFYKMNREDIAIKLELFLAQKWMINEHKQTLFSALHLYQSTTLDYIDCWLLAVAEEKHIPLETFDQKLRKQIDKIDL